MLLQITSENFESEVLNNEKPILVDFWAAWCGSCRMAKPVLDELSEEMSEKIIIAQLDIDAEQDLANQFDVLSIPTLILFKNGQPVDRMVGAMPKSVFERFIERNL